LAAMCGSFHPGTAVDRGVVHIIASAHARFSGVQPHSHPQRGTRRPSLTPEPTLASTSRLDRRNSARKDSEETVALPARDHHNPAMTLDHVGDKAIVLPESYLHRVRHGFSHARRSLNVGQQERDRPGRKTPLARTHNHKS
jgi:hypothetical protein